MIQTHCDTKIWLRGEIYVPRSFLCLVSRVWKFEAHETLDSVWCRYKTTSCKCVPRSHLTATFFKLLIFYVAKSFVVLMAMKSNYYVMGYFVYVIKNNASWCSGGHISVNEKFSARTLYSVFIFSLMKFCVGRV